MLLSALSLVFSRSGRAVDPRRLLPRRAKEGRAVEVGLIAALLTLGVQPARAELRVRVSKPITGKWQSVGITVIDPRQGLDAKPGPVAVTMADGRDRRQTIYLQPTAQAGRWSGRYTPISTGRFTGTAVLEREHDKDVGLVPLIRVRNSGARGFVRRHPRSRRALRYSNGDTLFPIALRISSEDLLRVPDWHAEVARMRAHDVNFLEVPVSWPEELPAEERERALTAVDRLLVEAERSGRLAVLLRLEAPEDVAGTGSDPYRAQLVQWTRRWAYSPALAAWYVVGASSTVSPEQRAGFVRAVREVDPYNHLIAVPAAGEDPAPADLTVAPQQWQRPSNRFALLEADSESGSPAPLPGENTWQSLVTGGIGLPIQPYRPGTPEGDTTLRRTAQLARAAGKVPYQTAASPVIGLVPADTPGSFYRYGKAVVGWIAPDGEHSFALPRLSAGRYQLLLWDPERDRFLDNSVLQFDGTQRHMKLPDMLSAVYFMLRPASGKAPASVPLVRHAPVLRTVVVAKAVAAARPAPRPKLVVRPKSAAKSKVSAKRPPAKAIKVTAKPKRRLPAKPVPKPKSKPKARYVHAAAKAKPAVKAGKRPAKKQITSKRQAAKKPAPAKSAPRSKRVSAKKPVARPAKTRKAAVKQPRPAPKRMGKRKR